MNKALDALFAEHETPTVCEKSTFLGQLSAIAAVTSSVHAQLATFRALLAQAEFSDHDPAIDGKFEHMHRTLAGVEAAATSFAEKGRALAKAVAQFDLYLAQSKKDLVKFHEEAAAK